MQNRSEAILLAFSYIHFPLRFSDKNLLIHLIARFNLGILEPAGSFRSSRDGRYGTAMRDNNSIYFSNPASYSSLDTNSFIFDFGLDYGISNLSDGEQNIFRMI